INAIYLFTHLGKFSTSNMHACWLLNYFGWLNMGISGYFLEVFVIEIELLSFRMAFLCSLKVHSLFADFPGFYGCQIFTQYKSIITKHRKFVVSPESEPLMELRVIFFSKKRCYIVTAVSKFSIGRLDTHFKLSRHLLKKCQK
ncbi:hypothetical protein ACJX0J_038728, partial [Zea mays]